MSSSVRVVVRLRPMNDEEKKLGETPVISASEEHNTVSVMKGEDMSRSMYSFNNVFTAFATQKEVFQGTLAPMIEDVLQGYESTVFAYGQTGTGKTHTMEGDLSDPLKYGVIPRSAEAIFRTLRRKKYESFKVTCSYLEIYNEDLCDLLTERSSTTRLEIMNSRTGTFCRGLSEKEVRSSDDVLKLMIQAEQSRRIGETKMNKHSSRSHCIFTINVLADVKEKDDTVKSLGKLHLVDLAGSENAKNASIGSRRSASGSARERERLNINRSLLTLGRVIAAVKDASSGKKNIRIPYRDSKLTRILQEALGGRSKTLIIATVSPSQAAIAESVSTLNYAQSANGIQSKPVASTYHHQISTSMNTNRSNSPFVDPTGAVEQWFELECKLKYMEAQIEEAQLALSRKEQQQQRINDRAEKAEHDFYEMETKYEELQDRMVSLEKQLENEQCKCDDLTNRLRSTEDTLTQTTVALRGTENKLEESLERESNLERHLKNEQDSCEDLTNRLHSTEETLRQTSETLMDTENKLEDSLGRESNLEGRLKNEQDRCEDLTNRLHSTEETLSQTSAVLKATETNLDESKQSESSLKLHLKNEKEKSANLTRRLNETEDALMKTSAVLEATEKTEEKLISEGSDLIKAVTSSIRDGDKLYTLLEEARDADIQRRIATKDFNLATANVLQDVLSKVHTMEEAERKYHALLTEKSNTFRDQDGLSINETQNFLIEIDSCVQSLTSTIKALSLDNTGVLPKVTEMKDNIKGEVGVVEDKMKHAEARLNSFFQRSCDELIQYEDQVKTTDDSFLQATESLRKEIAGHSTQSNDNIESMVLNVARSISKISDSSVETRKKLATILQSLQEVSLKTSKEVGQQALEQHSKMENTLGLFHGCMEQHSELQIELEEHLSTVDDFGKTQLGELSQQTDSLLKQKQVLAEAREEQKRIHSNIMTSVMHGVEELLSREMNRLALETEARFSTFEADNGNISKLNESIVATTKNILGENKSRNRSFVNFSTDLQANDSKLYDETILNNQTLMGIKEKLWQHHDHISDAGKKTDAELANLEDLVEPVALAMRKLDEDKKATSQYIVGTLIESSDKGFDILASKASSQTNFVVEELIPGVNKSLNELTNGQNAMYDEAFIQLGQIQQSVDSAHSEVKTIIEKQAGEVDHLRDSVQTQRTDFENNVIVPRKSCIEVRHKAILEDIENHNQFSRDHLSAKNSILTQLGENVNSFAANVIHANDDVPENEPRTMIPFSDNLSSTPSRQNIIANLNNAGISKSNGRFIDENNQKYINTYESEKETRDDVKVMIRL